jgi:YD repeat-containing protein
MTTTYSYSKPADNGDSNYADWCIQLSGKPCINAAHVFWPSEPNSWPNNLAGFKTATATSKNANGVQASTTTYTDLAYYGSNTYTSGKVWHYQPTTSVQYVAGDVGSTPYTQTDLQYDSYGHATRRIEYGLNTVSGDERTTAMGYFPNTTKWIVSKLAYENIYSGAITSGFPANNFRTQSRLYYDGSNDVTTAPTHGQLKKVDSGASQATINYAYLLITQTMGYDYAGNIQTITDPRNAVSTATYDDSGWFLKQVQNALGHTVKYAYYGVNEGDCSLSGGSGLYGAAKCTIDPNLQATGYTYDAAGNVTQIIDRGTNASPIYYHAYSYDSRDRLTNWAMTGSSTDGQSYAYNAIGNLTSKTGLGTLSYPASGLGSVRPHAVTGISAGPVAEYDANGNMTRRWNGVWYRHDWNADNGAVLRR